MIKIYAMKSSFINLKEENLRSRIDAERLKAIDNRHEKLREQSFAASILLDYALKKEKLINDEMPVLWQYSETGKPYFINYPDVQFSISHSGDWVVCALSDKPIGIDIQKENGDKLRLAKRFFHKKEVHQLGCLNEKEQLSAFYDLWVLKEAAAKMAGLKLGDVLSRFFIDFSKKPCIKEPVQYQNSNLLLFHLADKTYHLGICTESAKIDSKIMPTIVSKIE